METGNPVDGVFPDSMWIPQKVSASKVVADEKGNPDKRIFKVQIGGRPSPRWTNEENFPVLVVRLYDLRQQENDTPVGKIDNMSHGCEQRLVTRGCARKRRMLRLTW